MKLLKNAALMTALALSASACSYGGVAMNADGTKAVITRNDSFLFGLLRQVYVCQVSDQGVTNCNKSDRP